MVLRLILHNYSILLEAWGGIQLQTAQTSRPRALELVCRSQEMSSQLLGRQAAGSRLLQQQRSATGGWLALVSPSLRSASQCAVSFPGGAPQPSNLGARSVVQRKPCVRVEATAAAAGGEGARFSLAQALGFASQCNASFLGPRCRGRKGNCNRMLADITTHSALVQGTMTHELKQGARS